MEYKRGSSVEVLRLVQGVWTCRRERAGAVAVESTLFTRRFLPLHNRAEPHHRTCRVHRQPSDSRRGKKRDAVLSPLVYF